MDASVQIGNMMRRRGSLPWAACAPARRVPRTPKRRTDVSMKKERCWWMTALHFSKLPAITWLHNLSSWLVGRNLDKQRWR